MRDPRPFFRCSNCGKAHVKAGVTMTSVCVCGTNLWRASRGLPEELTTQTAEERAVLQHLRGHCHHSLSCPLCKAQSEAAKAEATLDSVISG